MNLSSEVDVTLKQKKCPWTCQNVSFAKKPKTKMKRRS